MDSKPKYLPLEKAFRHKGNLMRHMATHGTGANGEPILVKSEDNDSDRYVVVVVDGGDEQEEEYEDEGDEMELEEVLEEENVIDESESYTLTESE